MGGCSEDVMGWGFAPDVCSRWRREVERGNGDCCGSICHCWESYEGYCCKEEKEMIEMCHYEEHWYDFSLYLS